MDGIFDAEWEAWQKIVRLTKNMGCITVEDWSMAPTSLPETNGSKLIRAMEEWGRELGKAHRRQAMEETTDLLEACVAIEKELTIGKGGTRGMGGLAKVRAAIAKRGAKP